MKFNLYNIIFCVLLAGFTLFAFSFYPRWQKQGTEATIGWDVTGYYLYLPAVFIYKDLKHCAFADSLVQKYGSTPDFQQGVQHPKTGNFVLKYTCGQAILMLPWFALAHLWASNSAHFLADGFSYPYLFCVGVGLLIYAIIGLIILWHILRRFNSERTSIITIGLIMFGTNYLNYAAVDQGMTHSNSFTLVCILLYLTIKFWEQTSTLRAVLIGLCLGLITLVRPTDIVVALIPILWQANSKESLKQRVLFICKQWQIFSAASLAFLVIISIQLLYYKYVSNEWFTYSYGDQGFDWLTPHTIKFMFSYKCGWFMYCPLMLVTIIGGTALFIKRKQNVIAILATLIIALYIITSWHIWDYGVTSGRAMVQYYPLLAFLLASFIYWMQQKQVRLILGGTILLATAYISVWWCYHAHAGNIPVIDLTRPYYWRVLGRWQISDNDRKFLYTGAVFEGEAKNITQVFTSGFSKEEAAFVDSTHEFSKPISTANTNATQSQEWLTVYAKIFTEYKDVQWWAQPRLIMSYRHKGSDIAKSEILIKDFIATNQASVIKLDSKQPQQWDSVNIIIWNCGGVSSLRIDSISVQSYDEQ